ncbi:RIP metalloprotease RseP [Algicella marina]|uniref:Zinc metalloprotease n=1 Tax=Algicella marina TaxID=2683284 RepID=A0A6P1SZS3_9RHOB|nr:RIP metalloprotease RseP [Algicella marina]QHQ34716.1 RIP metalloprotease RseP [Algicella marina]
MELISQIPVIGGFLGTLISFVAALSIVVFVHEYGHYIVGRWCGIHAVRFSVGFGPVIAKRTDKRGTIWQVAALPLGGMVQFLGDADGASTPDHAAVREMSAAEKRRAFPTAAVWRRALAVAAGPFANFIFSAFVFMCLAMWIGQASDRPVFGEIQDVPGLDIPVQPGDELLTVNGEAVTELQDFWTLTENVAGPVALTVRRDGEVVELQAPHPSVTLVGRVLPYSAARRAGLEEGDYIDTVDGRKMHSFRDLLEVVDGSDGRSLALEVLRDGTRMDVTLQPQESPVELEDGGYEMRYRIGVASAGLYQHERVDVGLFQAARLGVAEVWNVIYMSFSGIYHMVSGALSPTLIQGPIGIAQMSGETASHGLLDFIKFVAVISTAIGMINLFPVPVLDGGHLVMFAYEAVRGKAPSEKFMGWIMPTGLALVLLLMLFATYNDIVRLAADFTS